MVCSACGYENQVGHRFCGMCGMPLPHRPLTAPGASSTLNLTRVPLDSARAAQHSVSGRTNVLTDHPASPADNGSDGHTPGAAAVDPRIATDEAVAAERAAISSEEAPPKELVPDLPLDEYVKSFRYEPPSDPTEITMRGDASVQEAAVPGRDVDRPAVSTSTTGDAVASALPAASDSVPPSPVASEVDTTIVTTPESKPVIETTAAAAADVDTRLGLEPVAPSEERVERPRFLDINQPPPDNKSGASGTSTIVGPSFLGLSDASSIDEEPSVIAAESAQAAPGRGRLWLAAAIVLIFAGLGAMEWRAQRNQSGNGPVEIIKTKIHDLRHQNSETGNEPATPASNNDSNTKPEMQVQEQPKPATPDQTVAAGSSASSSASSTSTANAPSPNAAAAPASTPTDKATTGSQVTAAQKPPIAPKPTATPGETQAVSGNDASGKHTADVAKPASSPGKSPATVAAPKPASAAADGDEVSVKQIVPGADEMTKAKNASDSAAEAAWLWKATAKGNPDAPVQLADMYVKGDGVPRSCEQAVVLLKTAANKENARARNRLASMYASGNCVPRNRVEAYRWVSSALAANPDSQWAQQNRDLLWQQMTPDERAAVGRYR